MGLLENLPKSLGGDMGVDLCSGQRGVAEKFLDGAQIRTPFQGVRGHGVSQRVGRHSSAR